MIPEKLVLTLTLDLKLKAGKPVLMNQNTEENSWKEVCGEQMGLRCKKIK
jgi:hypothetical protein